MSLRTVALDTPRPPERGDVCDPTGCAVAMCSSTMARRIAALRSSSSIGTRFYRVPAGAGATVGVTGGRRPRRRRRAQPAAAPRPRCARSRPRRVRTTRSPRRSSEAERRRATSMQACTTWRSASGASSLIPAPGAEREHEPLGRGRGRRRAPRPRPREPGRRRPPRCSARACGRSSSAATPVAGSRRWPWAAQPIAAYVAARPVEEVVAALVARAGPVRDLVPLEARRRASRSSASSYFVAWSSSSGAARAPAATALPERRAGLDGERVRAHVLGPSASAASSVAAQSATRSAGVP